MRRTWEVRRIFINLALCHLTTKRFMHINRLAIIYFISEKGIAQPTLRSGSGIREISEHSLLKLLALLTKLNFKNPYSTRFIGWLWPVHIGYAQVGSV